PRAGGESRTGDEGVARRHDILSAGVSASDDAFVRRHLPRARFDGLRIQTALNETKQGHSRYYGSRGVPRRPGRDGVAVAVADGERHLPDALVARDDYRFRPRGAGHVLVRSS